MTICQTITLDFESEMKQTRILLERVPLSGSYADFAPHAKSMTMSRLASHVAELPAWIKTAVTTDVLEMSPDFKPRVAASTEELLELFDESAKAARSAIAEAPDAGMSKVWEFKYQGQVMYSDVRTMVVRTCLNHLFHHRAQLGVYLRLNEIPVPGMYGPSADEGFGG